jgi:cytochrome c oxidase subunit 4
MGGNNAMNENASQLSAVVHEEHAKPNYVAVYLALAALTFMEIGVTFLPIPKGGQVVILLTFAFAKLALVVMYYMHLKFDTRLYTFVFAVPTFFALLITGVLLI